MSSNNFHGGFKLFEIKLCFINQEDKLKLEFWKSFQKCRIICTKTKIILQTRIDREAEKNIVSQRT